MGARQGWDEPAQASSPRGWLHSGALVVGFYLDYGPEHYRAGHDSDVGGRVVSFCTADSPCRDCQPGNVLAVRYPAGPGTADRRSRYVVTVADARAYVESGELARVA
jgi:hypothetical protein